MTQPVFRFYFSLRSPYVWLAVERLMRDGIAVDPIPLVRFADKAVFNDPAANPLRLTYIVEDVARLAARFGLTLALPNSSDEWTPVHNAAEFAKRAGRGMEFIQAAARARWTHSADLAAPEVIAQVAATAGVDTAGAVAAMHDAELRADMTDTYTPLIDKDQVFGVPFFAFDTGGHTHRYWGQDRIDLMLEDARAV